VKADEYRIALKNIDTVDPTSIEEYVAHGGIASLRKALTMGSENIIHELTQANLRGRGGAGFPAGLKERYTTDAFDHEAMPRYLVCNADEGEPGTFKDRVIMEKDPHLLIEGIIIAAYAIEATRGFVYIRGEYSTSIKMVTQAIEAFYKKGYLGNNILNSGFSLELSVKLGAGSYLCGEELTLLESLEGKRGYPRIKPPFPAESGLWAAPTLVNNVETFTHIPWIIDKGAKHYTSIGTESSPGTKVFTLSGDIEQPGFYELEMGQTLRTLVEDFGQGMVAGKSFQAALIGGAAGTFVDHTLFDVPMTYDDLKSRGAVLGSGAVMILGDDRSLFDITFNIMEFFKHESCGKCVPCRVGTALLVEMMKQNRPKEKRKELLERMFEEAKFMAKSSLCPLGQSPILAITSLRHFFKDQF
jgi:NADH:ubiquinone oxidoreductase subunit F (NADH-binding)